MKITPESKLFGTDGIRGKVGEFPLDDDSIVRLGAGIGRVLGYSRIVIGRDTRESGERIEKSIAAGVGGKADISLCGVIPTPGLSYLTRHCGFDYGIMITASHNPYGDNGIKFFQEDGAKIPPSLEKELEEAFFSAGKSDGSRTRAFHSPVLKRVSREKYEDFLRQFVPGTDSRKWKLVLDCANGATFRAAPRLFGGSGFDTIVTQAEPDGQNINRNCGSTYLHLLEERVRTERAHLGIAFDGDGDRVLFVDPDGHILDGDYSLLVISDYLFHSHDGGDLKKVVVGTIMANLGLELALKKRGIRFLRTDVGDKHVYREMTRHDAPLGGEQSGHTIMRHHQRTGDGILTALFFLRALLETGITPADVYKTMALFPQVTRSIKIKKRIDLTRWDAFNEMKHRFERRHGENARIVVRYSGTEPKIRVMIEARSEAVLNQNLNIFTNLIRSEIGE